MVKSYPKILLLGDSLTEGAFGVDGYGSAMVADYAAKCDVLNRGFGGYNSRTVLQKIKDGEFENGVEAGQASPTPIKLVVINLGTNDSNANAVPIEEFVSNLTALVTFFKKTHRSDVLLLTPSMCDPEAFLAFLHSRGIAVEDTGKSNETSRQYADAVLQVGRETGSPSVDLYELFLQVKRDGVRDEELFTDGLHYTPKAYRILLEI
ncbi:SGNH hydrolase-type esterase domain-containing protein [Filobasidium floriforme]|uniref:SGNH hydrolase-type esterase domain-containing protein n=1 Tax=Filobasidium floriforme TaxID=5210 RepID=UPI001E8D6600|nr:SGNH hydrolase-type esterase domain-containing protein [Filobasidium floriforme]KAH8085174.1 SGNH hydrolase-type esterase domain-containing protein [Filobasidium floriforme]